MIKHICRHCWNVVWVANNIIFTPWFDRLARSMLPAQTEVMETRQNTMIPDKQQIPRHTQGNLKPYFTCTIFLFISGTFTDTELSTEALPTDSAVLSWSAVCLIVNNILKTALFGSDGWSRLDAYIVLIFILKIFNDISLTFAFK